MNKYPKLHLTSANFTKRHFLLLIIGFVIVSFSFAMLDHFSISLGDDFGYMFTDSKLHCGDGHRVESFYDCLRTQFCHYNTTNGRFLVHLTTQVMLNLIPQWLYRLLNALVFGGVWLFTVMLIQKDNGTVRQLVLTMSLTWLMLWIGLPKPGMIMLSLVAFSVNYTWTAFLTVVFLFLLSRSIKPCEKTKSSLILWCFVSIIIGSLHESFSIPLSGAIFLFICFKRFKVTKKLLALSTCYLIGTIICVLAPGNMMHAAQTGGFALSTFFHKCVITFEDLWFTPIPYLFICLLVGLFINRQYISQLCKENYILLLAIIISMLFCLITYTSFRQLFAPAIFSIIIIIKIAVNFFGKRKGVAIAASSISLVLTITIICFAYFIRLSINDNFLRFTESARQELAVHSGAVTIQSDSRQSPYNKHPLLWKILKRYASDPFERSDFSLPFDGYSKRGLTRILRINSSNSHVGNILPYPENFLIEQIKLKPTSHDKARITDDYSSINTTPLDSRYNIISVSGLKDRKKAIPIYINDRFGNLTTTPYEMFTYNNITYLIFPNSVKTVYIKNENL